VGLIRPGPARLAAGLSPGGWVIHVYSGWDGRLLTSDVLRPADALTMRLHAERMGDDAAAAARDPAEPLVLVHYDGDTGMRTVPGGHRAGDRLT
jgi:hypothetical protein